MPNIPVAGPRLLVVPGLHDSGPTHWQSWLQCLHPGSVRVRQDDWSAPRLDAWAERIEQTLVHAGPGPWMVAAHSFGCLAFARWLQQRNPAGMQLQGALLVAPAEPAKFGVTALLPGGALPLPATLIGSETDPWMSRTSAARWAARWHCRFVNLGDAGHINAEAGFGPLPIARRWTTAMQQRWSRQRRPERADVREWSFAV